MNSRFWNLSGTPKFALVLVLAAVTACGDDSQGSPDASVDAAPAWEDGGAIDAPLELPPPNRTIQAACFLYSIGDMKFKAA